MSEEPLTNSEKYVKKTNNIILMIGLSSLLIFIFGLILLLTSGNNEDVYEEPVFTENADVFGDIPTTSASPQGIEFSTMEGEIPITTTPDPVPMGEVVLGTDANNVLTIGTNGKVSIKIVSVELAEPPFAGFTFDDKCTGAVLAGEEVCNISMNWAPVVAGNVQNNYIISWHEVNLGKDSIKSAKVSVTGNAVEKEDCTACLPTTNDAGSASIGKTASGNRFAIGPDGKVIGEIDEDGYVRDANGNIIGRVGADGLIVDENGNVIGVAENRKAVFDEFGNLIGYARPDGTVVDLDGNVIGKVLPDGRVVDASGKEIGKVVETGFVYDENGNIIGRVMPDGTVINSKGEVIGRVLPDGSVVDINGKKIGMVSTPGRVAVDASGKPIGVVMPDGSVVDENGNIIGYVDENGNVVHKKSPLVGKKVRVAYDANGNIIGYVDENGNLLNARGEIIGKMNADGSIVDLNGKVIGRVGEEIIFGEDMVIGKIVSFESIPITPQGTVLGTLQNDGSIENDKKQIVARYLPDGTVRDTSGKVVAKMVRAGVIVGFGCNDLGYLDKDGKIKKGNEETGYKINPEGVVTDADGRYVGEVLPMGRVFDNNCNFLGMVDAKGIVKDNTNRYIGCVNPDGSVLNESGEHIGTVGKRGVAVDLNGNFLGKVGYDNLVKDSANQPIGCVGLFGDVFNNNGAFIGKLISNQYAYTMSGDFINAVGDTAKVKIYNKQPASLTPNGLVLDEKRNVIGVIVPSKTTLINSTGKKIGQLFIDGNVYDNKGISQGTLKNGGLTIYNNIAGKIMPQGEVVDIKGDIVGTVNSDGQVVNRYGDILGHVNSNGIFFKNSGEYAGAVVEKGSAIGYDGTYIGYATSSGKVIDLDGNIVGYTTHDKKVADNNNEIIGEVIPESVMVDIMGSYKGVLNSLGDVIDDRGEAVAAVLPGGSSDKNIRVLTGEGVVDFGGNIIGFVSPSGSVVDVKGSTVGQVLSDGNVMGVTGKIIGEVIQGDIVISNDDKVVGYVNFDGKITDKDANIIGRVLSGELAVDLSNKILGKIYKIGATILGNDGKYKGRITPDGKVIDSSGVNIGYIKSNGSFINLDKNVAGYVLGEVAKNRRN